MVFFHWNRFVKSCTDIAGDWIHGIFPVCGNSKIWFRGRRRATCMGHVSGSVHFDCDMCSLVFEPDI